MIIDADCHLSSDRFDSLAITANDLIAIMDKAKVDKALVWLKPPYNRDIIPENRAIFEATRVYADRLLGFGWANPRLGVAQTQKAIETCIDDFGFYGIKFNGAQDDYIIDDTNVSPFIEMVAMRGKTLAFHIGADFPENTHPFRLGRIAEKFPETTCFMIHMGGAAYPALDRSAIEVAKEHANIHIIASAIPERAIFNALEQLGPERISFGSDTPFYLMPVRLAMFNALLQDFSPDAAKMVLGGNIARLLSIEIS